MRSRSVFLAVVLMVCLVPLQAFAKPDPIITVSPVSFDFGEVELGDQAATSIAIGNTGGHDLIISSVEFYNGGAAHYAILTQLVYPYHVVPGGSVEIEVAFLPQVEGVHSARVFLINNSANNPYASVNFSGEGVEPTPGPFTIQDILDFFDEAVDEGTLDGVGPCPAARRAKRRIFRRMLVMAGRMYDRGNEGAACRLLNWTLLRSDGVGRPMDFVAGEAQQELNDMIVWLLSDWACE